MDPLINQRLGKYQIERLLGEGGMGAVYQARHVQLGQAVAIKVMHAQFARLPEFRDRFLQEAQTAARLDHPGIVKVHDFVETSQLLYIVMEFIQGDNLQQMLEQQRSQGQWIPLNEAVQLIRQVGLALDYAHRQGVLHRDIKPANIMLKLDPESPERFQPIITDLGLAKLSQGGLVTQTNTTMGTPAYMSPEQLQGDEIDARSDVYSLGVLLYELAVGRRPFPIRSMTEAIRYHTRVAPPPPRSIRADLPPSLEQVILRAMAKAPRERFSSAAALVQALTTLAQADLPATVPASAREAMSLYTQVQESFVVDRGASLIQEFSQPSVTRRTVDQLQILTPDGKTSTVPMQGRKLLVGRDETCDLPLKNDERVSRHHLRIESDGQNYRVIDLGSTNGTRLGSKRLQPNVAEIWLPEQPLRVGKHTLRLLKATVPAMPTLVSSTKATQAYKDLRAPSVTQIEADVPVLPIQRTENLPGERAKRSTASWVLGLLVAGLVIGIGGVSWRFHLLPADLLPGFANEITETPPTATPTVSQPASNPTVPTDTPEPATPTLAPTDTPAPTDTLPPTEEPSPTFTVQPTDTPVGPTDTPIPTSTPVPTSTPAPTSTPRPTNTLPPPTPTPRPPTPTSPPPVQVTATPTRNSPPGGGLQFTASVQVICNDSRREVFFEGRVMVNGQPQNGYRVAFKSAKVPGNAPATDPAITGPNGGHGDWSTGYYLHIVDGDKFKAKDKSLQIWVMDGTGSRISDYGFWHTDGASGACNRAIINFSSQ